MKNIHYILFTLTFAIKSFTDGFYISRNINTPVDDLKYIVMIISMGVLLLDILFVEKKNLKDKNNRVFARELKNMNIIIIVFIFISLIFMLTSGEMIGETIKELVYLYIPVLYAYLLLNKVSIGELDRYFTTLLVCFIGGYILEIYDKFSLASFFAISYAKSYSPFESAYMSGSFTILFTYFLYRKMNLHAFISFIFTLMTFKRLSIVFAIFILIVSLRLDRRVKVSISTINIIKIFFIVSPIIIYFYLRPEYIYQINSKFNIDLDKLLMGRAHIFNSVLETGFKTSGYGSTTDLVLRIFPRDGHIHLDLVKIFMEVTIIGLVVFVNNVWNIVGRNAYCVIIMMYQFLNLLTSHSLRGAFTWAMIYLTIGVISIQSNKEEKLYEIKE